MRITKISIKNYRTCLETSFEPNAKLSALIGPNGSGKTNILSAIKLLPSLCLQRAYGSLRSNHEDSFSSSSEIKTWYEISGKKLCHTVTLNIVTNEKNQDEIVRSQETWYMYDFIHSKKKVALPSWLLFEDFREKSPNAFTTSIRGKSSLSFFLEVLKMSTSDFETFSTAIKSIAKISYYSASQFTNPANCPISFEVEGDNSSRRTGISISGHKKFLYDLYQETRNKTESSEQFLNIVGSDGIGLIDGIEFKEVITSSAKINVRTGGKVTKSERNNLLVVPSFKILGNDLSPSQLSEGTFKTLALIFYLVVDKSPILMIEEPEVCVHHGLLSSIIELIKIYSNEKQIIISTHSDSVLDKLSLENVFSVKRDFDHGTIISSINKKLRGKELLALKSYLNNEGSLGEYWKHGDLENV